MDRARLLSAWLTHDVSHSLTEEDRDAANAVCGARDLVVELCASRAIDRETFTAFHTLGRLHAARGATPSLAAITVDGLVAAFEAEGAPLDARVAVTGREALIEGYFAGIRDVAAADANRAWDFPKCIVPIDKTTVAICASHPSDDREVLSTWAAKVAGGALKRGARRAYVSGSSEDAAWTELVDALSLVGIEILAPSDAPPEDAKTKTSGASGTKSRRLPWPFRSNG